MTIVVGIAPGHPSRSAVRLGAQLARTHKTGLVLAAVAPSPWPPRLRGRGVDTEYQEFVTRHASAALSEARAVLDEALRDDVDGVERIDVREVTRAASSARKGLLEICDEERAIRLVIGAQENARDRHGIALGSTATSLLQSAPLPVVLAPATFDAAPQARIQRITAAYSGSDASRDLVRGAAAAASTLGADLRIAAFHTHPRAFAEAGVGLGAEDEVLAEWERMIREQSEAILDPLRETGAVRTSVAVGSGDDWGSALRAIDWSDGDILYVGSTTLGPLARISLGSHAAKIVRAAPVPVVVVPKRASEEFAAED